MNLGGSLSIIPTRNLTLTKDPLIQPLPMASSCGGLCGCREKEMDGEREREMDKRVGGIPMAQSVGLR